MGVPEVDKAASEAAWTSGFANEHLVAAGHGLALRAEAQLSRTIASML
jgi:hypothetical protein